MPTLTYLGESFDCATAIKGADYIHLLDDAGVMVAAFDAITDFSGFKLTNGSYTSPTADMNCYLAVVRDDGTIAKGGHKCSDIPQTAADVGAVPTTRTVNGKALSSDISLVATDVGARPNTWMPTAADVGAAPIYEYVLPGNGYLSITIPASTRVAVALVTVRYRAATATAQFLLTGYASGGIRTNVFTIVNDCALPCGINAENAKGVGMTLQSISSSADGYVSVAVLAGDEPIVENVNNATNVTVYPTPVSNANIGDYALKKDGSNAMSGKTLGINNGLGAVENSGNVTMLVTNDRAGSVVNNRLALWKPSGAALSNAIELLRTNANGETATYSILHTGNITENGVAKIETGSYVGTGTDEMSLTFGFVPKFVYVAHEEYTVWCDDFGGYGNYRFFWMQGMTREIGPATTYGNHNRVYSWDGGNTLSWDHDRPGDGYDTISLNLAGEKYVYVAIG